MIICDICGCKNDENSFYCVHCGNWIAILNMCPCCNTINLDDATVCSNCNKNIHPVLFSDFTMLFSSYNKNILLINDLDDDSYLNILKDIFYDVDFKFNNNLKVKDNILKLASNFAVCKAKSRGMDFGYSFGNIIFFDDRLDLSIQFATILHELAHVILSQILENYLSKLFKVKSSIIIQSFVWYCFNNNELIKIMSEYCAHTVEGRFIPYGYQNYNSFNNLVSSSSLDINLIREAIVLGNSYANEIIVFLENYITEDFRELIKTRYKLDLIKSNNESISLETEECFSISNKNEIINKLFLDIFDDIDFDELNFIKEGLRNLF